MGLEIDNDTAVSLPLSPSKIIDANNMHLPDLGGRHQIERPQQRGIGNVDAQFAREALTPFPTGGEADVLYSCP